MRTVRIDFTSENMLPDGGVIGRMGEHNATDLVITPPTEMTECEEIVNYVAAFVTEGKIIRSDFYPKAEQITVSLCAQLTQDHSLSLQLEGYDGTGGLVVKSPIVNELTLMPSAGGDEADFDSENGGIVSQINLNSLARHNHINNNVLNGLGEENGALTYNGKALGSSPIVQNTKTLEFDVLASEAMIETENNYMSIYICDFAFETPPIAQGTEIISIEMNTILGSVKDEWVDLRDMIKHDKYTPYFIHMPHAFYNDLMESTCISIVDFYTGAINIFSVAAANYQVAKIRVTFVDGSED